MENEPAIPPPENDIIRSSEKDDNSQLALFIDIEEKRIDSTNKKTEVVEKLIKAQDDSDKRQFEYSMNVLEERKQSNIRVFSFQKHCIYRRQCFFDFCCLSFLCGFLGRCGRKRIRPESFGIFV